MNGLQAVLEMTDRVQAAIAAGDWQAARDLEVLRRGLLEQWLAHVGLADARVATALNDLEQRGRHMVGDVQHHRRRVLRDAQTVTTGRAAAAAYGATPEPEDSAFR